MSTAIARRVRDSAAPTSGTFSCRTRYSDCASSPCTMYISCCRSRAMRGSRSVTAISTNGRITGSPAIAALRHSQSDHSQLTAFASRLPLPPHPAPPPPHIFPPPPPSPPFPLPPPPLPRARQSNHRLHLHVRSHLRNLLLHPDSPAIDSAQAARRDGAEPEEGR